MITKCKVVATLGPATSDRDVMRDMIQAGVNVFRINFSHASHEVAKQNVDQIHSLNDELGSNVAILADLQGPKLRVGVVKEGTFVKPGGELMMTTNECEGDGTRVFMTYQQFPQDVKPRERILLDDGKLVFETVETNGKDEVKVKVIQGGPLKSKKGVNLPNTKISLPCLTEKDMKDLHYVLDLGVEWVAISFVRQAEDVMELKSIIRDRKSSAKVISKIEKPGAVADITRIIKETDALMVARGDLGVEIPMQGVPLIQKMITQKARAYSKPVIIATQMMESMIDGLTPTRAEVNDVANSVLDGADAMMLSGETSVGKYPVEVIKNMKKIIAHVEESSQIQREEYPPFDHSDERYVSDSICYNASRIADQIGAKAVLTNTHSGYTAFKISSHRPRTNIYVFTQNRTILNTLSLLWGVQGFYYDEYQSTDQTFQDIKDIIVEEGLAREGDLIIKIASMPIEERGMTNMLKISKVE